MTLKVVLGLATVLFVNSAHAFSDVCTLVNTPIAQNDQISADAIAAYKQRLSNECALSEKYQQMSLRARDKFGATLEQIMLYQALRVISRSEYEAAKASGVTIQLPDSRSAQLAEDRTRLMSGLPFGVADLQRVNGGQMKPASEADLEWRKLTFEEVQSTKAIVSNVNQDYANLGFLADGLASLYDRPYMNEILSVKKTADGGEGLYSGDTRANEHHLKELSDFMEEVMRKARLNQHIVWHDQILTPGEVAYFVQKYVNDVHPFVDGNERTSRYMQELLLTTFGLPHGATGDLMGKEVLVTRMDYYNLAMSENRRLLVAVDQCLEVPKAQAPVVYEQPRRRSWKSEGTPVPVAPPPQPTVDYATIEYGCRILR